MSGFANLLSRVRFGLSVRAKDVARVLGVELQRARNALSEEVVLGQFLAREELDFVVDVGANEGQYAGLLRECGYRGPILSFEPLEDAYERLRARAAADAKWLLAPRMALGEAAGELTLNVAGNSASSSLLPMLSLHEAVAPHASYVGSARTPVRRLDEVLPGFGLEGKGLLKVDTQGFEDRVLAGASGVIGSFVAVQLELSLSPLYDGQAKLPELVAWLAQHHFELAYFIPGLRDPRDGRLLQADGIFVRRSQTT